MALAWPRWWPSRTGRRNDPFTRATHRDLDIAMPPPYDMSDDRQETDRADVEARIGRLQGGLDGGSREVLNNLINAWADQATARLDGSRDERQAVGEVLIGLARQRAARRKPRYDADLARAWQAYGALQVTFATLTGRPATELQVPPPPALNDPNVVRSTLGQVDIDDILPVTAAAEAGGPDRPEGPAGTGGVRPAVPFDPTGGPQGGMRSANGHGHPRPADTGEELR